MRAARARGRHGRHQDNYYEIAVMATYPPLGAAAPAASGSTAPLFE